MRSFNQHMGSSPMALVTENVDVVSTFRQMMSRLRLKVRHSMCSLLYGAHELYPARTDTKLYQECLLCGYETPGWTIDRRDRRMQLVSSSSAMGRR